MRIDYYSGSTLPSRAANSVHVMKMCEAWGRAGHDVTLFAKGRNGRDVYGFYGVQDCFKIKAAPHVRIPFLGGAIRLIHAWLSRGSKPDLAYGRDAAALFFLRGKQTVFEAHQMPSSSFFIKTFQKIVVISDALKKDMQARYRAEFFTAHDGASIVTGIPVALMGKKNFQVGYAGSLHAGKGLETMTALAQICPEIGFHVFGGEEAQIEAAEKYPNLFYYGHIPHGDLPGYLAACDVLIAPYQAKVRIRTGEDIARWISPLKIFEYMAARRPIICSDLPVIREILKDGENAILVKPGDIQAWKDALMQLQDKDLRDKLAQNAYRDLEKNYTWDQRAANILGFCSTSS